MALQDYDNKRQYTKYKRHVNESHEKVNAATVNTLQKDLNVQQQDTNTVKDNAFEERVYTIFNNNLYTNAMFIDYFKTGEYINADASDNIKVDYEKSQVLIDIDRTLATIISVPIYSVHGNDVPMNDFFLVANEYIPIGAEIKYYLEESNGERWPILANSLKLPMHLTNPVSHGFKIVIEFIANALGESPVLNGYAVLYWDAQVEENLGMTNPDLMRFP